MNKLNHITFVSTLTLITALPMQVQASELDCYTQTLVNAYQPKSNQAEWTNPYYPEAAGNAAPASYMETIAESTEGVSEKFVWINNLAPTATGEAIETYVSADQHLNTLVAQYTRERLDRGGWENNVLRNSEYASGNILYATVIGSGVTENVES